jgi:hypothetical protein
MRIESGVAEGYVFGTVPSLLLMIFGAEHIHGVATHHLTVSSEGR